jgi:hypothetical protein
MSRKDVKIAFRCHYITKFGELIYLVIKKSSEIIKVPMNLDEKSFTWSANYDLIVDYTEDYRF